MHPATAPKSGNPSYQFTGDGDRIQDVPYMQLSFTYYGSVSCHSTRKTSYWFFLLFGHELSQVDQDNLSGSGKENRQTADCFIGRCHREAAWLNISRRHVPYWLPTTGIPGCTEKAMEKSTILGSSYCDTYPASSSGPFRRREAQGRADMGEV